MIFSSVSDPYHLAGTGSTSGTSGNVDPDPGSKKNRNKLTCIDAGKVYIFIWGNSSVLTSLKLYAIHN